MSGRWVVIIIGIGVLLLGAASWGVGLRVQRDVDAEAAKHAVPRLSREEAAMRVAKDDMFGLPSRLEDPPTTDMAVARMAGTRADPFSADDAGVARLFETYAVTVKGCRSQLPDEERATGEVAVLLTLQTAGDAAQIVALDGPGEGIRTGPFTTCVLGGMQQAVFSAPGKPQLTLRHVIELP